jgi:hypothetical protein
VLSEEKVYVKFDSDGHTEVVRGSEGLPSGYSYRRVHFSSENEMKTEFSTV